MSPNLLFHSARVAAVVSALAAESLVVVAVEVDSELISSLVSIESSSGSGFGVSSGIVSKN